MQVHTRIFSIILLAFFCLSGLKAEDNPIAIQQLLSRIGGKGAEKLIETEWVKESDASSPTENKEEWFAITSRKGKPCIKGNTLLAITTGINWYLNHHAHINLAWNNPTVKLRRKKLPVPLKEERHSANVPYRYYLNYCTFSYSMATWTWERWQQEIDWMALHGINMPLQIIGLDVVWQRLLEEDYGYSRDEVNKFVAGPAFQAWWGMNNLEGWGGPNPDWWYKRQEQLAKKILQRERELGIEPVLPGFSGMVPSNFSEKTGLQCLYQGGWCGFVRPMILDPSSESYAEVSDKYYKQLENVMGKSRYYSMDPFHEGGQLRDENGHPTSDRTRYEEGYRAVYKAMERCCGSDTKWVIQQWQWADYQALSLKALPKGKLIVLDLFSDGQPTFDYYQGFAPQEAIYCAIPNFGGRTGFFGRIPRMAHDFDHFRKKYPSIKGIGAAPEAIEQTPVVYDLLFELPWLDEAPDTKQWIKDYATARYGVENEHTARAWELLRLSALNNTDNLQGPHEAVMCARPSLQVGAVSTWGGTHIFYDSEKVVEAVDELLLANLPASNPNYSYDLCDLVRQVLSDRSKTLLEEIRQAHETEDRATFESKRDAFLQLILDTDRLLATNRNFRLGNWTEKARAIADEVEGTTEADRDWLELQNARTLITTWGDHGPADGGLRDYSYRQWQGMLSDYYYPRWKYFFDHDCQGAEGSWFFGEWEWAHNLVVDFTHAEKTATPLHRRYTSRPQGNTVKIAKEICTKIHLF